MDKDKIRNGVRKYNEVNDNLRKKLETYDRLQEERKEAFNNNKHVKRFKRVNDFIFKYVTIFTLGAMSPVFFGFKLELTVSLFMGIAAVMTVTVGKNIIKSFITDVNVKRAVTRQTGKDSETTNVISLEEAKIKKTLNKEEESYDKAESI